jgi:hypothetical protein
VNYSGAAPRILEGGKFGVRFPGATDTVWWCTGHCPVAHRTVRCARPRHTSVVFCSLCLNPFLVFLLVCCEPLAPVKLIISSKLVSPIICVGQFNHQNQLGKGVSLFPFHMLVTSFQGFQMKPVTAQALFQRMQDHEEYLQAYVRRFLRLRAQAPTVPNEIVIEAMIKGLRPGPTAQYFARKPPQTLEKLLQKMDEYIRADNDFRQRREEAYRFSEMTRGFGGRIHPRHVRSIHSSSQNDDKGSQSQRSQYTSQSLAQQQSSFRPPAPRGRGARGFGGRFGDQPRKIYYLFCGEDKGHTTRMCQITIQKQKEIAKAEAR